MLLTDELGVAFFHKGLRTIAGILAVKDLPPQLIFPHGTLLNGQSHAGNDRLLDLFQEEGAIPGDSIGERFNLLHESVPGYDPVNKSDS